MTAPYRIEALVLGLGLITLGVLWTLSNLGYLSLLSTLRTWWPLWLVLWGTLELLASLGRRRGAARRTR